MIEVNLVKDGPGVCVHVWDVDETKPPMQVVGHFYEFNRMHKQVIRFKSVENFLDKITAL
jgi:hypothetical protein